MNYLIEIKCARSALQLFIKMSAICFSFSYAILRKKCNFNKHLFNFDCTIRCCSPCFLLGVLLRIIAECNKPKIEILFDFIIERSFDETNCRWMWIKSSIKFDNYCFVLRIRQGCCQQLLLFNLLPFTANTTDIVVCSGSQLQSLGITTNLNEAKDLKAVVDNSIIRLMLNEYW